MGAVGLVQPFNDAIKLFTKELVLPEGANKLVFILRPVVAIGLSLLIWVVLPVSGVFLRLRLRIILIYMVLRINIYPLMASGWASNRAYASIGALRGVAQTVSYEVRFALIILVVLISGERLSLQVLMEQNCYWLKGLLFLPLTLLWLVTSLAETNRTPFDFAEGESELVSGFNVEYGGVGFALIFIAEYARIYFMARIFTLIFCSSSVRAGSHYLLVSALVFMWIWVRATLPRYRYDMLMRLAWLRYLPIGLIILSYAALLLL